MKQYNRQRGFPFEVTVRSGPLVLCLLLILPPAMASADTLGDQFNHARQQLSADYDKRAGLVQARTVLKSQSVNLNAAVEAFRKQEDRVSHEMKDLNQEIAETNHEAKLHNSGHCVFSLDHPDNCAAFDAETKRLKAAAVALKKKEEPVEADKNHLEATRLRINADTEAWNAAVKKNDSDYNENEKEIGSLRKRKWGRGKGDG